MTDMAANVGGVRKKLRWPRWRTVLIVFALIVVATAAGAGLRWLQQYRVDKQTEAKQAIIEKVDDIQNTALQGDYDKSNKAIEDALKKPGISSEEKYALLFQQGLNHENQKKYDDAIKSYKSAGVIKDTQSIAEAIARTAESKGDKQLAITYYKKAITLIPDDYPLAESAKKFYEQSVKNLGGTP